MRFQRELNFSLRLISQIEFQLNLISQKDGSSLLFLGYNNKARRDIKI
jgi:hypothetical protein